MAKICHAQNLVPNYSFELYDTCPFSSGQINFANSWKNPTNSSPDYFNPCNATGLSVPSNFAGNQISQNGLSYAGIITAVTTVSNYREYMQVQLLSPLLGATCYKLKFFVSIGDNYPYGVNTISAYFSDTAITDSSCWGCPLLVTPQFVYNSPSNVLGNKTGWTKVEGQFMASGGEEYMTIGNFKLDSNTIITFVSAGANPETAYYYIDSVSLTPTICDSSVSVIENTFANNYKIYPNPNNGSFTAEYSIEENDQADLCIYSIEGRKIACHKLNSTEKKIKIQENLFSNGMYFYQIHLNGNVTAQDRLIIIK
jgi:hypothetical protein